MNAADEEYGSLNGRAAGQDRVIRRLNSIEASLSFRLGKLLVISVKRPWNILLLPITLPILFSRYLGERMGRFEQQKTDPVSIKSDQKNRNCVVLFPTNGVGMGHYSRMFALAKSMKLMDPKLEIVFFTTNYVLHPLYREGFTSYHLPNRNKFDKMGASTWNLQCEEMLANVFSVHKPSLFVFDGAFPYRGMLNAIKNRDTVHKAWVRRIQKPGKDKTPIEAYNHFDRIIVPGDLLEPDMNDLTRWPVEEINLTPPLLSISRDDLYQRGVLRERIGIPNDSKVALISLGAGSINDIENMRDYVVKNLTKKGIYVIIADSMLNPMKKRYDNPLVRIVQEFPIMRYRNCFDFAVMAAGYNSIHEMILLRLPSVIIPNKETQRDDQLGRATKAIFGNKGIIIDIAEYDIIDLALERISDDDVRKSISKNLIENVVEDGAKVLSETLLRLQNR